MPVLKKKKQKKQKTEKESVKGDFDWFFPA